MRRWSFYLLPFVTACMGTGNPSVLSNGMVGLPGDPHGVPQFEPPAGDPRFALLLNDERSGGGVTLVTEDSRLSATALAHAGDMVANRYLSHTDLQGGSVGDRASRFDYNWNFIAENIAQGFVTNESVMDAWMHSPGHAANIVDPRAEDFGIGRVGTTWVLVLGREFAERAPPAGEDPPSTVPSGIAD
ncbi:MAG: CAP domain-containing protein [Rubellimicrobium sp.]|nr:CAP domain-containing protein [Rubellimicrobium sp.]